VWLADILKNLRVLIDLIRYIIQSEEFEDVARTSLAEHNEILSALRSGDEAAAIRAMNNHIVNHRRRIRARAGSAE